MMLMTWQGSRTVCVSQATLTQSDYEKLIDYAWEETSLLHANNEVSGTESHAVTQGEPAFRWSWYERWSEKRIRAGWRHWAIGPTAPASHCVSGLLILENDTFPQCFTLHPLESALGFAITCSTKHLDWIKLLCSRHDAKHWGCRQLVRGRGSQWADFSILSP